MMCDGEVATRDVENGQIHHFYISLRPSSDRDVIRRMLAGEDVGFPPDARIYRSRCAIGGIERGTYP